MDAPPPLTFPEFKSLADQETDLTSEGLPAPTRAAPLVRARARRPANAVPRTLLSVFGFRLPLPWRKGR